MKKMKLSIILVVGLFFFALSIAHAQVNCSDLTSLPLPNATITSAYIVPSNGSIPEHCFASGIIEKEIYFEVKLPTAWNGKFIMFGNGGFAGSIQNDGSMGLQRDYATAATDTGHTGGAVDASWALNNMKRKLNFGFRAVHLTAVRAKLVISAFYGEDINYSYFMGCSRGGGQAMIESQQYPNDFDGIIAGAPAYNWSGFGMGFIWNQQLMYPNPSDLVNCTVPTSILPVLDNATLSLCDDIDGLMDGLIDDPRNCPFDPETDLDICPDNFPNCFTADQIEAIKRVYDGPSNSKGQIFPGFAPGAEGFPGSWDIWITDGFVFPGSDFPNLQYGFGDGIIRYFVYDDPDYDFRNFDFETDVHDTAKAAAILNGTQTNLVPFKVHGGKLFIYNGWADQAITPLGSIKYYEQVLKRMGGREKVEDFFRLFLVPGMLHCGGGPGPNQADWLTALELWVEDGTPPDRIVASGGAVPGRTRPLCPYPKVARWTGAGSINDEANFDCVEP